MPESTAASSRHPLTWTVSHSAAADLANERLVPATVPGAVQLDWARTEGWPPFWHGEEHRRYGWMEDANWHYRTPTWSEALATLAGEDLDHPHFTSRHTFVLSGHPST